MYWKGYGGRPTQQQKEIEERSFKCSDFYKGENVEIVIEKTLTNFSYYPYLKWSDKKNVWTIWIKDKAKLNREKAD